MILRDKKELLWILVVSTLIMSWGSLPTWMGYQLETSDLHFRGLYFDSQDYAAHIAMMEAGIHGDWTYQFRFTTESFNPAYVRIFYVFLGHISRLFTLGTEPVYHLARWLLGIAALYTLYALMRQIFQNIFWARTAFLLAALGSGLGWLQLIFKMTSSKITPIDFWLIDSYVFFSLSIFPHFAFVTIGMCITLSLWLKYLETPNIKSIFWIIFTAILVQFTNPIALVVVDAGLFGAALFSWWNKKKIYGSHILGLSIIAIVQIPLLVYNVIILNYDPLWAQYTKQHETLSPPLDYYFWGFALFWPLAFYGAVSDFREKSSPRGMAIFWVLAAFFLAYAPLYTQRRFLQNITIPLAILSTQGLMKLFETIKDKMPRLERRKESLTIMFVFLASLSSIQIGIGQSTYLQSYPENFFYPASLDKAIVWFRKYAQYDEVVLASEATSQVLAQKAGVRVYYGHEMETLDYTAKRDKVLKFFQGNLPSLASEPIQWVVYGPLERKLAPSFPPPDNLQLVYDNEDVQIYLVK